MTAETLEEFRPFPKIARLRRAVMVTEKLDGTNAQVVITEDGAIRAGSRSRWVTPEADNHGFAAWVEAHKDELLKLGPGRHFGEWWGRGIQRGYGLNEKRFSLFNIKRWADDSVRPACCHVVPLLYEGAFSLEEVEGALRRLRLLGSFAAPEFKRPEGVVVYHTAAGTAFKVTLDGDDAPKGQPS